VPRKKVKKQRSFRKATNTQGLYQHGDWIEELDTSYGGAYNMLRKKWIKLKIANRNDDEISRGEAKAEINNIQNILGIPSTIWKEDYDQDVEEFEE
jgi:hypothetical protein